MRRLSARAVETSVTMQPWSPANGFELPQDARGAVGAAQAAYKQAYLEGFEAGFADGDKEARKALEELQEQARSAFDAVQIEKDHWQTRLATLGERFAHAEKDMYAKSEALAVAMAYAAVCRIVGQGYVEQEFATKVCREVLKDLRAEPTQVRVAPSDYASLQEAALPIPVAADANLQPGDCVIVTGLEEIETGIAFRLRSLLQTLLEALGQRGETP